MWCRQTNKRNIATVRYGSTRDGQAQVYSKLYRLAAFGQEQMLSKIINLSYNL